MVRYRSAVHSCRCCSRLSTGVDPNARGNRGWLHEYLIGPGTPRGHASLGTTPAVGDLCARRRRLRALDARRLGGRGLRLAPDQSPRGIAAVVRSPSNPLWKPVWRRRHRLRRPALARSISPAGQVNTALIGPAEPASSFPLPTIPCPISLLRFLQEAPARIARESGSRGTTSPPGPHG